MRFSTYFLCLLGTASAVFAKPVAIRKRAVFYEYVTETEWETLTSTHTRTIKIDATVTKTATTTVTKTESPSLTANIEAVTIAATTIPTNIPSPTATTPAKLRRRQSRSNDRFDDGIWRGNALGDEEIDETITLTLTDYIREVVEVTKDTTAYTSTKVTTTLATKVITTLNSTPTSAPTATTWTTQLATASQPSIVIAETPTLEASKPLTAGQKSGIAGAALIAVGAVGSVAVCYLRRRKQLKPAPVVAKDPEPEPAPSVIDHISPPLGLSVVQSPDTPSTTYLGTAQSVPFQRASLRESRPRSAENGYNDAQQLPEDQHQPSPAVAAAVVAAPHDQRESFITVIEGSSPISESLARSPSESATITGIMYELPARSLSASTASTIRAPPPPPITVPEHPVCLAPGLPTPSPTSPNRRHSMHPDCLTPGTGPISPTSPNRLSAAYPHTRPRSAVSPVFNQPAYTPINRKAVPPATPERSSSIYAPYRPESQQSWVQGDDHS